MWYRAAHQPIPAQGEGHAHGRGVGGMGREGRGGVVVGAELGREESDGHGVWETDRESDRLTGVWETSREPD